MFLLRAHMFGVLCDYKYSSYGVQKFAVWNFFKYFDILPKVNTKTKVIKMTDTKKISLIVQHAYSSESGYAFLSHEDRGTLGISAGDYVKVTGEKTALAKARFHPNVHPGKVVLTKDVRIKSAANFDSPVSLEKITPLYADKITIQPKGESIPVQDADIFRNILQGELVYKGYEFNLSYYYNFIVSDVSPSEYAIVTSAT